jgi:BolA protein
MSKAESVSGATQKQISTKLSIAFAPTYLEVENESHSHSVPKNSETHFRVLIVSEHFQGLSRVQRQRLIYDLLKLELSSGVHALAQRAYTPLEWQQLQGQVDTSSPLCHSSTAPKKLTFEE